MTDNELIKGFIENKDDMFFNRLYKQHETESYSRCFRYISNESDVQDIFQNIWVIVYFHLKDFKFKSEFSSWLYRITTNQCINFLKQKKNFYSIEDTDEEFIVADEITDDYLDQIITKENVTNVLAQLSKEEVLILKMRYLDDYSFSTIAKITGLGSGSLRMRINRIKKKLWMVLENEEA